jgi:hypothetical protein
MNRIEVPILLIAWRRPAHIRQVIDSIRIVKPSLIFVAVDGPRVGIEFELERQLIEQTKQVIESQIDWDCEIIKLYRTENMGCGLGVSSAITWFFEQVEYGIILEDDCVPNIDFFNFCELGLLKYINNEKIGCINGINWSPKSLLKHIIYSPFYNSYFSANPSIWGWATWARVWRNYKYELDHNDLVSSKEFLKDITTSAKLYKHHFETFKSVSENIIDTWDYQFKFLIYQNKLLCLTPFFSLIENIGFDELATHTKKKLNRRFVKFNILVVKIFFKTWKFPDIINRNLSFDKIK